MAQLFDKAVFAKGAWIDVFLDHVMKEAPNASARRVADAADSLYARYGEYDPVDVAEASWGMLPLEDASAKTASG